MTDSNTEVSHTREDPNPSQPKINLANITIKNIDIEIREEDLTNYIDDFTRFASRKNTKKYKNRRNQAKFDDLTREELERRTERDLRFMLYRMKKKVVDPSLRKELFSRTEAKSKEQLINEIIVMKKLLKE